MLLKTINLTCGVQQSLIRSPKFNSLFNSLKKKNQSQVRGRINQCMNTEAPKNRKFNKRNYVFF